MFYYFSHPQVTLETYVYSGLKYVCFIKVYVREMASACFCLYIQFIHVAADVSSILKQQSHILENMLQRKTKN